MTNERKWPEMIAQYGEHHRNPINQKLHLIGIPMIALSLVLIPVSLFVTGLWKLAAALFVVGWIFQFVGHAFEGRPPEFFKDWRFLLVGLRWWLHEVSGKPSP